MRIRTRAYFAWKGMRQRCTNPRLKDYKNYGQRGITYDPRWESYDNFLADMGEPPPGLTLERVANDKDYGPTNCKWATRAEQNLNKRSNVRYELNGKSQTLSEWSRETGIGRVTLLKRIQAGMPLDVALTTKGFLGYYRKLDPKVPSNAQMLEHDGRVQSMSAWAREFGIQRLTLRKRLALGWTLASALTMPRQKRTADTEG